jgi:hypothetical protein
MSKTISVTTSSGDIRVRVSNETEFDRVLQRNKATHFVDKEQIQIYGFDSLENDGSYTFGPARGEYTLGPPQQQQHERAKRARYQRYTKGVDPGGAFTLPRDHLVLRILKLASEKELVLLKGPAAVGKSSLMNITEYYCENNEYTSDNEPTPSTAYTFMEKDGKAPLEQLKDAVAKMKPWISGDPLRILFCDDIQNVDSSFWEKLVNAGFTRKNNLSIVGATTRRCTSDPASPLLQSDALITFSDLRLTVDEENQLISRLMMDKTHLLNLDEHSREMLINAVTDQCGGHVFAIIVSLDKLDEFAQLPANQSAERIISYLLSKAFLNHAYTRIWPPNTDDFTAETRLELENAMMDETALVSTDVQSLLLKVYFIQDTDQSIAARTWPQIKQEITFKLSARRLYSSLFSARAPEDTQVTSIRQLVERSLSKFKRVDLMQSRNASESAFPKEGALQQMFFLGLTSALPASTEIVSEMSAIFQDRGDKNRGELDFYVNSTYFYGIELMRLGSSFKEHKDRFLAPLPEQATSSNRGKYFTPLIKDFRIVDFRRAGFQARNTDAFRLLVVFNEDYSGCKLLSQGTEACEIRFASCN